MHMHVYTHAQTWSDGDVSRPRRTFCARAASSSSSSAGDVRDVNLYVYVSPYICTCIYTNRHICKYLHIFINLYEYISTYAYMYEPEHEQTNVWREKKQLRWISIWLADHGIWSTYKYIHGPKKKRNCTHKYPLMRFSIRLADDEMTSTTLHNYLVWEFMDGCFCFLWWNSGWVDSCISSLCWVVGLVSCYGVEGWGFSITV